MSRADEIGLYYKLCMLGCHWSDSAVRGGFNGRPLVQWPTGPQASHVMGAPEIAAFIL